MSVDVGMGRGKVLKRCGRRGPGFGGHRARIGKSRIDGRASRLGGVLRR